ncbi:MAG: hypothetical protein LBS52_03470 [Dysgonamonadaceae bacterium]|jgi:C-terminal processing protease CtpA/Prc|nr:hypothetical protein [Dysgonamonadaceae bacterium]
MKKITLLLFSTIFLIFATLPSCEDDNPGGGGGGSKNDEVNLVSQFVYDGMSSYYLWNKEILSKKPTAKDSDPEKYFYGILNSTDTKHAWSWITDDVESLLASFSGEETKAFGFNPFPLWFDDSHTRLLAFVRFVFPNTPAFQAGLKRGEIITHVNGVQLNGTNYSAIYGATATTTFTVCDQNMENPRDLQITPGNFSTDPVLYHDVHSVGGKKIGYLFYTNFIGRYNASLYAAFQDFKQAGIDDLVLDLRYNTGGEVSAAIYLASLTAPKIDVQNKRVFTTMSYNDNLNAAYDKNKWDRNDYLGAYDKNVEQDPLNVNMDLDKVYIIATGGSYSASELLTFCLAPYMDVKHIGEKTGGKYTASITLHAYDSFEDAGGNPRAQPIYNVSGLTLNQKSTLKNWAMQPIVGRYTDKNGKDFIDTDGLVPDYAVQSQEYNTSTWKPIGNEDDYLFAKAISLIAGTAPHTAGASTRGALKQFADPNFFSPKDQILKEAVIIDKPQIIVP